MPGAIALAAESGRYDGFVALGVVIRGETWHFEIVAGESARALMALTLDGLAIGNGILTVENEAQALARARPDEKDKGGEAAKAALAMLGLKQRFASGIVRPLELPRQKPGPMNRRGRKRNRPLASVRTQVFMGPGFRRMTRLIRKHAIQISAGSAPDNRHSLPAPGCTRSPDRPG